MFEDMIEKAEGSLLGYVGHFVSSTEFKEGRGHDLTASPGLGHREGRQVSFIAMGRQHDGVSPAAA